MKCMMFPYRVVLYLPRSVWKIALLLVMNETIMCQTIQLKVVDPLFYREYWGTSDSTLAALPGMYVEVTQGTQRDTLQTNGQGIVDITLTSVESYDASNQAQGLTVQIFGSAENIRFVFSNQPNNVALTIFNILGQTIKIFGPELTQYRELSWDLRNTNGKQIATGFYLFRVDVGGKPATTGKFLNVDGNVFQGQNATLYQRSQPLANTNQPKEQFVPVPIRVRIMDEFATGVGNYYDYDSTFESSSNIPPYITLFPGPTLLKFEHPGFSNSPLAFLKWYTYSDDTYPETRGTYLVTEYPEDQPTRTHAGRDSMPNPLWNMAFDSAKINWEQVTSFWYRGLHQDSVLLRPESLIVEVQTRPAPGVHFTYWEYISFVAGNHYVAPFGPNTIPTTGPKYRTQINVRGSNTDFQWMKMLMQHEWKHYFFQPNNSFRESTGLPGDDDFYPHPLLGKLLKVIRSLQHFFPRGLPRMGVYREE